MKPVYISREQQDSTSHGARLCGHFDADGRELDGESQLTRNMESASATTIMPSFHPFGYSSSLGGEAPTTSFLSACFESAAVFSLKRSVPWRDLLEPAIFPV